MTASEAAKPVRMTRRERQRQATYEEIVSVSRRLLTENDGPSLRAIAGEMGMTAPALYRYVGSHRELLALVAGAVFEDVVAALTEARDRFDDDDPGAQILAAAVAFRRWAMRNPAEFGLIFANAQTSKEHDPKDNPESGSARFGTFFAEIYERLWHRYQFPIPSDDELDPAVLAALAVERGAGRLPCDFPGAPLGLSWVFIRAWVRLYGTVTLEVFRHMDAPVIDSGALFRAMLDDNARDLAFGEDEGRLRALIEEELRRAA